MDSLRERLLTEARLRLENRSGAFDLFQHQLRGTTRGIALAARAEQLPAGVRAADEYGVPGAREKLNALLAALVDEWAASLSHDIESAPGNDSAAIERLQATPESAGNATTHESAPPTAKRRDLLRPLIERAQRECGNLSDAAAIWPVLVDYAKISRRPLIGLCDEGIKWVDASDETRFFTLKHLRDRLRNRTK